MSADGRRVVITGIGVVAPGSMGREGFWEMITAGRTATRRITFFDPSRFRSQVAAEVDFDGRKLGLTATRCTATTGSCRWPWWPRTRPSRTAG